MKMLSVSLRRKSYSEIKPAGSLDESPCMLSQEILAEKGTETGLQAIRSLELLSG